MLTLAGALLMTRAVRAPFSNDRLPRIGAVVLVSMGLGILVIGVGQLWAFAVEAGRIGNDHLGHRGLRIQWGTHRTTTFALAALAMWIAAAIPALHPPMAPSAPKAPKAPKAPGTNPLGTFGTVRTRTHLYNSALHGDRRFVHP